MTCAKCRSVKSLNTSTQYPSERPGTLPNSATRLNTAQLIEQIYSPDRPLRSAAWSKVQQHLLSRRDLRGVPMIEMAESSIGQDPRIAVVSELGLSTETGLQPAFLEFVVMSVLRADVAHSIARTL